MTVATKNRSALVQSKVSPTTKKKADKIFRDLGLNTSQAVNIFLSQVIIHRGIPFDVNLEPKYVLSEKEDESLGKSVEELKKGKGFKGSMEEGIEWLNK